MRQRAWCGSRFAALGFLANGSLAMAILACSVLVGVSVGAPAVALGQEEGKKDEAAEVVAPADVVDAPADVVDAPADRCSGA